MIHRIHDELSHYCIPYQTKRNAWILGDAPFQGNIYRYTSFTNLLSMLEGKFYLSPRLAFSDRREQGEYTSEYIKMCYKSTIDRNRQKFRIKVQEKFKLSTYFNVSCWTMEDKESFPMWKAYKGDGSYSQGCIYRTMYCQEDGAKEGECCSVCGYCNYI